MSGVGGTIIDENGKPLPNVRVTLDGPVHRVTVSGAKGTFAFRDIPEGRYTVTFAKLQYRTIVFRDQPLPSNGSILARVRLPASLTALKLIGSVVSRERSPFNSTPAALKVFPREAYRDQGQAALTSVLTQTPGAIVAQPSQQNAAQPMAPYAGTVRGGFPWETATLVDGNPIALPSSGSFNLAYIASFLLQEVEIVKGYGSTEAMMGGAIDGALNLRTADPGASRKALLELEADSRGGQFSDLAYGGTAPGGRFSFASMLAVDGNPGPAVPQHVSAAALQRAELLKLHYDFSDAIGATFAYAGSQGTLGVAAARGFTLPTGFGSFADAADAQETHRFGLYSLEIHADAARDHVTAKMYALRAQRTGGYGAFAFPAVGSGIDSLDNVLGFSLQDDRDIAGNLYQLQATHSSGSAQAFACSSAAACGVLIPRGARSDESMLRAAAVLHPGKATDLQAAAAALWFRERYSGDGGNTFRVSTVAVPVVHAGAAFHIRPALTARLAVGTGAGAPPAAVLNSPTLNLVQTPVGLPVRRVSQSTAWPIGVETAFGYDAGVEYRLHGDTTTLSADAYRTLTHGAYLDASSAFPAWSYQWMNAPPMTHEGFEFALQQFKRVGLGFIAQVSLLRTYVNAAPFSAGGTENLAVVPNTNVTGGSPFVPGANDIAALRAPYAQGYAEISYKWPRGSRASLGALYLGANNPYARAAFAQFNANLELSLGSFSKLQISVQNLTNAYDAPLPLAYAGEAVPLITGAAAPLNAGVVGPRTIRFMFRQSIGGSLFER